LELLGRFVYMVWAVEEGVMNYDCIQGNRKWEKGQDREWTKSVMALHGFQYN
jgi:hypothetical protein